MKEKQFSIPEEFLSQLQEFTNGYALFAINSDGDIEVIFNPTDEVSTLALMHKIKLVGLSMNEEMEAGAMGFLGDEEDE